MALKKILVFCGYLTLFVEVIGGRGDNPEEEDQEFAQFAQHMGDFNPTQSFEFSLKATEQETLILWPTNQIQKIRGVFYITSDGNKGLFMGVEGQGQIKKSFYNKKLGVFSVPYSYQGDIKLIFKAEIQPLKIYISYQLVKKAKEKKNSSTDNSGQNNESEENQQNQEEQKELAKVLKKFQKVKNSITFQQLLLKQIISHELKQTERLNSEIQLKSFKIILETIFVIAAGLYSLWLLRQQFRKGYEILV